MGTSAPAGAVELVGAPPAEAWARTAFVWSGDVLLAESERMNDALATVYVYEPGTFRPLAVATRDAPDAGAAVYHYHVDHLGTPQELTDALGQVAWQAEYRAWGAVAGEQVGDVAQPLRIEGQYADGETGLCYNYFGYYSPAEGRRHARAWNGMPNMQGDLRIPRTGEVLASKVSPTAAFDRLMEWHKEQTAPPTGGSSCSF